jgi:hypothetical protein
MADESSLISAPMAERRAGTAMLSLQLRSAQQLAAEAESTAIDRVAARAELRGRLAILVERRRQDLDVALNSAQREAAEAVSAAIQEAKVIVEAATLMAQASRNHRAIAEAPVMPAVAATSATDALPTRAAVALLTMQLRTAERLAHEAEAAETTARQEQSAYLLQVQQVEQRREVLEAELHRERAEATRLIAAANAEASGIRAQTPSLPPPEPLSQAELPLPAPWMPLPPAAESVVAETVVVPLTSTDNSAPLVGPAAAASLNVVIDAEAFARVFAAAFSSLLDERLATAGAVQSQPIYPPMYAQLPVPPAVVKQSFWSHAKHVDVLLLSGAMVIVLVVLAAWLA